MRVAIYILETIKTNLPRWLSCCAMRTPTDPGRRKTTGGVFLCKKGVHFARKDPVGCFNNPYSAIARRLARQPTGSLIYFSKSSQHVACSMCLTRGNLNIGSPGKTGLAIRQLPYALTRLSGGAAEIGGMIWIRN